MEYQERFHPVIPELKSEKIKGTQHNPANPNNLPMSTLALKHTLDVPIVIVSNLTVQPGEPDFIAWLAVSSLFPLIAACMAPLGNLISLVGLVEHWRIDRDTNQTVKDDGQSFALNVTAFVMGILGNFALLMNFSRRLRYEVVQTISIVCWVSAASFLLAAVLISNASMVGNSPEYRRSEGFWLAVFTIFMYYSCSIILVINFIGFKLGKYPDKFNLDRKQRQLMSLTIVFAIWQAIGSLAMRHLIPDLTYGASLYYCTVSILTIGLGDIVPFSTGAKLFALVFSLIGEIIMGLVIANISRVVVSCTGPCVFWHLIEKERVRLLNKFQSQNIILTPEESFYQMRLLRARVKFRQKNWEFAITLSFFLILWLLGALVFHHSEGWGYFNSVYFCFLCLLTIGYGDYHPTSAFGRVFFVQWAFVAVPLMTMLVPNVGGALLEVKDYILVLIPCFIGWSSKKIMKGPNRDFIETEVNEESLEEEFEMEDLVGTLSTGESKMNDSAMDSNKQTRLQEIISLRHEISSNILDNLHSLGSAMFDSLEEPDKRYTVEGWTDALNVTREEDEIDHTLDPDFWLSEYSPLRLPLKEPNYLMLKMFVRIEHDLRHLMDLQQEMLTKLSKGEKFDLDKSQPRPLKPHRLDECDPFP